jgi:hypothetical protein
MYSLYTPTIARLLKAEESFVIVTRSNTFLFLQIQFPLYYGLLGIFCLMNKSV